MNNSDRPSISPPQSDRTQPNQQTAIAPSSPHHKAIASQPKINNQRSPIHLSNTKRSPIKHLQPAIAPIKNKQIAIAYSSSLQQGDHS